MKRVTAVVEDLRSQGYKVTYRKTSSGHRITSIRGNGIDFKCKKNSIKGNQVGRHLIGEEPTAKQKKARYKNYTKMVNKKIEKALNKRLKDVEKAQRRDLINAYKFLNNSIAFIQTMEKRTYNYKEILSVEDVIKQVQREVPSIDEWGFEGLHAKRIPLTELAKQARVTAATNYGFATDFEMHFLDNQIDHVLNAYVANHNKLGTDFRDYTYEAITRLKDYVKANSTHMVKIVYTELRKALYEIYQAITNYGDTDNPAQISNILAEYTGLAQAINAGIKYNSEVLEAREKNK